MRSRSACSSRRRQRRSQRRWPPAAGGSDLIAICPHRPRAFRDRFLTRPGADGSERPAVATARTSQQPLRPEDQQYDCGADSAQDGEDRTHVTALSLCRERDG
jgi:hypothetical protein